MGNGRPFDFAQGRLSGCPVERRLTAFYLYMDSLSSR